MDANQRVLRYALTQLGNGPPATLHPKAMSCEEIICNGHVHSLSNNADAWAKFGILFGQSLHGNREPSIQFLVGGAHATQSRPPRRTQVLIPRIRLAALGFLKLKAQ
jgi:hypothetical protein